MVFDEGQQINSITVSKVFYLFSRCQRNDASKGIREDYLLSFGFYTRERPIPDAENGPTSLQSQSDQSERSC